MWAMGGGGNPNKQNITNCMFEVFASLINPGAAYCMTRHNLQAACQWACTLKDFLIIGPISSPLFTILPWKVIGGKENMTLELQCISSYWWIPFHPLNVVSADPQPRRLPSSANTSTGWALLTWRALFLAQAINATLTALKKWWVKTQTELQHCRSLLYCTHLGHQSHHHSSSARCKAIQWGDNAARKVQRCGAQFCSTPIHIYTFLRKNTKITQPKYKYFYAVLM